MTKRLLQPTSTETLHDTFERLLQKLEEKSGAILCEELRRITNLMFTRARTIGGNEMNDNSACINDLPAPTVSTGVVQAPSNAVRRRRGTFDLPDRKRLKTLRSGSEKLEVLLSMREHLQNKPEGEQLTEQLRVFVFKTLKPALGCYTYHCSSNQEIFLEKWGCFRHSEFRKNCCHGTEGEECMKE
jgi:hypothetical protein